MPLRSDLLANLGLAALTLLLCFLVLEAAVRLFVDVNEYRPIGIHHVDPENPLRFVAGREHLYESSEFRYRVRFNRFGRRDVEWSDAVVADPRSILFIGDSFVLGNGVEHEDTLGALLEERFAREGRPREVLNFGMPAGSPPTYARVLEEALASGFAAGTVLVGIFVGNDFYESILREEEARLNPPAAPEPEREAKSRWLPHSQLLHVLTLRVSHSARMVGWVLTASRLLGITVYDTAGSYIFLRTRTPEQQATFDRILDYVGAMKERSERAGRRFAAVVFPNKLQIENGRDLEGAIFDPSAPNRRIMEYCAEIAIPCLDLLPAIGEAYASRGEPLYFPIDRHLNVAGTRAAAQAIGDFLEREGL